MSDAPVFRVNPALNPQDCAETFRREGVVQISDFFEPDVADYLTTVLKENTYWRLVHSEGERRAAYTLGFTRGWRPDWGGQLLFHDQAGDITRGLRPTFNVLTLFKTPRAHSVAQVATYATEPRLTISGWLVARQAPPA